MNWEAMTFNHIFLIEFGMLFVSSLKCIAETAMIIWNISVKDDVINI